MKKLLLVILLLVIVGAAAAYFLKGRELLVYVSEEQIQQQLAEAFPVERQYLVLLTVRLTDPRVDLVEGSDRLHYEMAATASVQAAGRQGDGRGRISGRVRYDAETQQVYLEGSRIEQLEIEGIPAQYQERVREVADLAVREHLDRRPIYTLDEETLSRLPGPVALRDVRVEDGRVRLAFGLGAATPQPSREE